eukprot:tig00021105_g18266.t1
MSTGGRTLEVLGAELADLTRAGARPRDVYEQRGGLWFKADPKDVAERKSKQLKAVREAAAAAETGAQTSKPAPAAAAGAPAAGVAGAAEGISGLKGGGAAASGAKGGTGLRKAFFVSKS